MSALKSSLGFPSRLVSLLRCAAVCLTATPPCASAAQSQLELGIDRSNLTLQNEQVRQSTLEGIRSLHATWFRDVANESSTNERGLADLVDVVSRAKALHLKVLLNLVQLNSDFADDNAGAQKNRCGWSEKKFSEIDQSKLVKRLETLLGALKAAKLTVDAFEIGNEDDTYCYNADVPNGHEASEEEFKNAVRGYAHFLQTAAELIRKPEYYPQAALITFGIAHSDDRYDVPPHHISRPARFVAALRNVDGVNYLDNNRYHITGFGTHIYASPNNISGSAARLLREDEAILGHEKPFWITEWGFLKAKAFPNQKGQSLSEGLQEFLATLNSLRQEVPLGPIMFYSYNNWLVDEAGNMTPAAEELSRYAAGR